MTLPQQCYITSETLLEDKLTNSKKQIHSQNFVYTRHAPNEKDAMTSRCLDRKEVLHAIWRVHSTGQAWPVETQDVFF